MHATTDTARATKIARLGLTVILATTAVLLFVGPHLQRAWEARIGAEPLSVWQYDKDGNVLTVPVGK